MADHVAVHATDWCAEQSPRPCRCWVDGESDVVLVDPDRLPPTVVPAVVDELGGLPVRTPALRPGLL